MEERRLSNLNIEGARLIFRNFAGKEKEFNPAGVRNFCVILDNDLAEDLKEDGWNVKYLKPRDAEERPQPYLPVAVRFDIFPPKVVQITSKNKVQMDESDVNILDYAEIINADLVIRPRQYNVNGKEGVKAYLKAGYFTIQEDEFASKYEDSEELPFQ